MSEPKFTPGPWRIVRYCEAIEIANVADLLHFYGGETAEANAALIAAAPELYAALEAFLGWAQSPLEDSGEKLAAELDQVTVYAYAALAKARGGVE